MSRTDSLRQVLRDLAAKDPDYGPMELEAVHKQIDAFTIDELKVLLRRNGFTFVIRKELQVVRAIKQTTMDPGTGVSYREADESGGAGEVEYFTELAGQYR